MVSSGSSSSSAKKINITLSKAAADKITKRSGDTVKYSNVESIIASFATSWETDNQTVKVKPSSVPDAVLRPVACQAVWAKGNATVLAMSVDFIPCVVVPGMPTSQYPKYMKEMIGYTMASTAAKNPHMASSISKPKLCHLIAVVTSVRIGAWSALNVLPLATHCTNIEALHWSTKSSRLYVRGASAGAPSDLWRYFHSAVTGRIVWEEEIAMALCVLAPLFLQMGASSATQSGEAYAVQYVERAISSVLKKRLRAEAHANSNLGSKATWQALREAPLTGMCVNALKAWASDSLLSAGANYRMATNTAEADHWASRENAIREGAAGSTPALPDDTDSGTESGFVDQFTYVPHKAKDEDESSAIDTVFGEDSKADDSMNIGASVTAMNSPGNATPVAYINRLTMSQTQQIRDNIANAHVNAHPAASAFGGVEDDETVNFETS